MVSSGGTSLNVKNWNSSQLPYSDIVCLKLNASCGWTTPVLDILITAEPMIMEISFVKVWQFYSPRIDFKFKFKTWAKKRRVQMFFVYDQLSCWHCHSVYETLSYATWTVTWTKNGRVGEILPPLSVWWVVVWVGFTLALWERAETVGSGLLQHCEKAETERAQVWFTSALWERD